MRDYPFTILDVAGILNLKVRRRQPTNMDVVVLLQDIRRQNEP